MKVIFIIASLHGYGGTNRVASVLANELAKHHDITIISQYIEENSYPLSPRVKDIKFKGNQISFLYKCKNYLRKEKPTLIITHTMSKLTPMLLLTGVTKDKVWSLEHISFESHNRLFKRLRKILYPKINKIIVLTKNDYENYENISLYPEVIANPSPLPLKIEPKVFQSNTILSIGHLVPRKGFDRLIRAWSYIEQSFPRWQLHIYGEGDCKKDLEKLISILKVKNVYLIPPTSSIKEVYDNAEIFVMSSHYEGLPMVLIEAQSRGLPIVSFDCPSGPAEIINDGVDGFLVEDGNIEMLAEKIIYLIEHKNIRRQFSNNALISAKRFEITNIISKWNDLIERSAKMD